jgi:hypothetical protein
MNARPPASALVESAARIVLRPIGNPLPLGFLALAGATLVVSGLQLEWLQPADGKAVALILIAFVFPLQLLVAVFGYLGRDVVAGTGMGILAGTWLSVGLVMLTSSPGSTSDALGLFLLVAAVSMLIPAAAAGSGKLVPLAVVAITAIRFANTGLYERTASPAWPRPWSSSAAATGVAPSRITHSSAWSANCRRMAANSLRPYTGVPRSRMFRLNTA